MTEPHNILLVNHDSKAREKLHGILTHSGGSIIEVDSGEEAIERLANQPVDLVVADASIDTMDGWQLTRLVRSGILKTPSETPIVIVSTAYSEHIARVTANENEVNYFIPFGAWEQLSTAVDAIFQKGVDKPGRPSLLVVEDYPDTVQFVRRVLGKRFDIEEAMDGRQGLEAWQARRHDLVLLDVMLPSMAGPDVLREILKVNARQSVVIMTAYSDAREAGALMLNGAADFIPKPFKAEQLRRVCNIAARREDYIISNEQFAQSQQALLDAKRQAESANQAKSEFLATMSHEIRTPLHAIVGLGDLLMEEANSQEQRHYLQVLQSAGDALMSLINDVLDLSKVEAGELTLDSVSFHLRALLEDIVATMTIQAFEKKIALHLRVHPEIPTQMIGDPHRLRQVLINLLSNAMKFTQEGEVVLDVIPDPSAEPGRLIFSLRDSGIGISDDQLEQIFNPFTQVDSSSSRQYQGTGLGLSISRKLVHLMSGEISVESVKGKGSLFRFNPQFIIPDTVHKVNQFKELDGHRILLNSDDQTGRNILKEMLDAVGLETILARESEPISDQMMDSDLVILDIGYGNTVSGEIRHLLESPRDDDDVPMILICADPQLAILRQARNSGAVCLPHPIRRVEALNTISAVLLGENLDFDTVDSKSTTERAEQPHILTGMRILLVEDSADNVLLFKAYMKNTGIELTVASNGLEAVSRFKQASFDLVLMDLQMPHMDGFDATKLIRQWEVAQGKMVRTPIVAVTAYAMPEDAEKAIDSGCDCCLTKPIRKKAILKSIEAYVHGSTKIINPGTIPDSLM
ncbi:MAG: response regulator [Magnetococcales bacterium]|nr:response regulator [Magnetococcales bacterium]